MPDPSTKPCPFCGEPVLLAAKKCKHCGEFMDESVRPAPAAPAPPPPSRSNVGVIVAVVVGVGLVGVFVVGILAAMLLPALAAVKESANRKRCTANLKQIGLGVSLYQQKNQDALPPFGNPTLFTTLHDGGTLADPAVYQCPSDEHFATGGPFRTSYATWARGRVDQATMARAGQKIPLAWDYQAMSHTDVRNVLFLDGHVEEWDESRFEADLVRIGREHSLTPP